MQKEADVLDGKILSFDVVKFCNFQFSLLGLSRVQSNREEVYSISYTMFAFGNAD